MSFNTSTAPPSLSSSVSFVSYIHICLATPAGVPTVAAFTTISLLFLLPLYVLVLSLGLRRWRQQQQSSTRTMSHCDLFTYHLVAIELLGVCAAVLILASARDDVLLVLRLGVFLHCANLCGQIIFHVLTCMERYLAVVHPIFYLSLRNANGIRARNVLVGSAWLVLFAGATLMTTIEGQVNIIIVSYSMLTFPIVPISFFSVMVLWALLRPPPGGGAGGGGGGGGRRVKRSKLRPFYTIMVILGVLLFRFVVNIILASVYDVPELTMAERCGRWLSIPWVCLPTSPVLPLLFLHRAGKLPSCRGRSQEPGRGSE